jgi:hypothetical protein
MENPFFYSVVQTLILKAMVIKLKDTAPMVDIMVRKSIISLFYHWMI